MQSYDVADMFKQYLRELPECLVTSKLSDTFLAIYQHIPQELRLEALQSCILLLPGNFFPPNTTAAAPAAAAAIRARRDIYIVIKIN